jgi:DNA-binding response OmpR family regulator
VEDDAAIRGSLIRVLTEHGHAVTSTASAMTALRHVLDAPPDLILLDLGLPGGDGYQVLERLKTLTTTSMTPVIVLSAKDPQVHGERAKAAGADAFIQKPAESATLLSEIRRVLGEG